MIPAQKGDKINLSLEKATARAETWRCLNQAGAPLYWCPWSIDAALNSTSANRPITIKAIAHSIAADPEALLASSSRFDRIQPVLDMDREADGCQGNSPVSGPLPTIAA